MTNRLGLSGENLRTNTIYQTVTEAYEALKPDSDADEDERGIARTQINLIFGMARESLGLDSTFGDVTEGDKSENAPLSSLI